MQSIPVQSRLFKSLKLWSFYIDLEESIGSVEATKVIYDKVMDLKIANAQTIVNYAQFLEENKYFEESFKASPSCSVPDRTDANCFGTGLRARYRFVQLPGRV